jgi:hypothetical protein
VPLVIASNPKNSEPGLQYVIYVSFAHSSSQLQSIAPAFTVAIAENLPSEKKINFKFHSASCQSLNAILASHRDVMNARPEMVMGAYKSTNESASTPQASGSESQTRIFPQHRQDDYTKIALRQREPYRTFFIIIDRPDFLTAPGVLFLLTDGNENTDEWKKIQIQNIPQLAAVNERGDYWVYQVWQSVGMREVARRLAMLELDE